MSEKMELEKKHIYVVNSENEAARDLMKKICERGRKPGAVVFVTSEEFEVLKDGVIILQTPNRGGAL